MHIYKINAKKLLMTGILSLSILSILPSSASATVVYEEDNSSNNYIEHNVNKVNNRLDDATYIQDNFNMISEIEDKRQSEERLKTSKKELEEKVMNQKFEEKMRKLQEKKNEELRRASMLGSSDADERAKDAGMKLGSIGATSVKLDLDIIYKLVKNNKEKYTSQQIDVIKNLPKYLGKNYVWGATGPSGYDCSGFTSSIMNDVGVKTTRTASDQFYSADNKIEIEDLRLGDLVFFKNTGSRSGITHVGLYIGDGLMVHASQTYNSIKTENVFGGYFSGKYAGAARYID